jgi:hypothetical protein
MPLTDKGSKIMQSMKDQYGSKKGESVFYASKNAGKIQGVDQLGSLASFAAREVGETAGSEAIQEVTGGGSSGSALRTAVTFASPEGSVPTQSQSQENAGLGRPANAGPFGGVPASSSPPAPTQTASADRRRGYDRSFTSTYRAMNGDAQPPLVTTPNAGIPAGMTRRKK